MKTHKCSKADVCKSTACSHAIPHEPKDCTGPAPCGVWPGVPDFKPMVICLPAQEPVMPELKPVAWMWEHHGTHVTTNEALAKELGESPEPLAVTPLYAISHTAPIPEQLRTLAQHMKKVSDAMAYYGGFDSEASEKSLELLGAASIAEKWASAIEAQEPEIE